MKPEHIQIMQIVERELSDTSHNIEHVMRVYKMSLYLADDFSDINLDILKVASLLHDIARVIEDRDGSGEIDHAILGAEMSETILLKMKYSVEDIQKITHCIRTHRFRSDNKPSSIEAKILFDADKLDILGAVGIARIFMTAGKYGEKMYVDMDINDYAKLNLVNGNLNGRIKNLSLHAPNIEFQSKIQQIPDRLYTKKARSIAKERLDYMFGFFSRLNEELKQ